MTPFEEYALSRGWRTNIEYLPTDDDRIIQVRSIWKSIDDYAWWTSVPTEDPPQSEWEFRIDFAEHGLQVDHARAVRP